LSPTAQRDRGWWESRLLEAGFRKHPLAHSVIGYEELNGEGDSLLILCEKIPTPARVAYPLATLKEERNLHMDRLREPGIRSEAHLARYILAREYVRAGGIVLDAACGLGYGTAALASGTGATRVIGVDLSDWAVTYARENFARTRNNLEYFAQDATHLAQLADESVDLVVCFETLEHMPNPEGLLREFTRVLRPGGVFIGSVPNLWIDEQGCNPVPYHLHIYDYDQFRAQIGRHFEWQSLYRQNAGGGWKRSQSRWLRAIPDLSPSESDCRDAEWWIGIATKGTSESVS
jgi:2-polyprenyl-3-methyl-5-hydroxy-6-metoxy-1,4-benzoquinol methylase